MTAALIPNHPDDLTAVKAALVEKWLPIPDHPNYDVSDQGGVRSWSPRWGSKVPHLMRPDIDPKGYPRVTVRTSQGRSRVVRVHRLLLEAFVGPRPDGQVTRHLDGNPAHSVLSNLAYGTGSQNALDAVALGTWASAEKTHCPQGHEYTPENTTVSCGRRNCRQCRRDRYHRERAVVSVYRAVES